MRDEKFNRSERAVTDGSLGGSLAFVALLVVGLLVVSYPVATLGVTVGVLLGLAMPRVLAIVRRWTRPTPSVDFGRKRPSG